MMSGTFFKYYPGHVDVRFVHDKAFDYLRLWVRLRGDQHLEKYVDDQFNPTGEQLYEAPVQNVSCRISSVFCPFHDYLRWLEAIVIGVQECAWEWDAEGPIGRMVWSRRNETTGFLEIFWPLYETPEKHAQVMLYRRQMVEMFYGAFRRFVESPAYDPLRYESLYFGELIKEGLGNRYTQLEIMDYLVGIDRWQAIRLIDAIQKRVHYRIMGKHLMQQAQENPHQIRQPMDFETCLKMYSQNSPEEISFHIPECWTGWPENRRREYLQDLFKKEVGSGWSGSRIRNMRSVLIENWLTAQAQISYQHDTH